MRLIADAAPTREVFWGLSTELVIVWYVLATASVVVFGWGIARLVLRFRRGRAGSLPARRELLGRLRTAARDLVTQARIARRDPMVGWAHRGIFYGFLVLFIGTVVLGVDTDITQPLFGWQFFQGDFYLWYSLILDVAGVALLVGVLAMMLRRGVRRPARLDYTRPDRDPNIRDETRRRYRIADWIFVSALLYLVVTGYVLEGVRIAMDRPGYDEYSPVGWLVGETFVGLSVSEGALSATHHVLWWLHGLVALVFVAAIPFTKAAHMLTSFASMVVRNPEAGRRLAAPPAGEPVGYGEIADFTISHLIQLDGCTRCGRCHAVCPANATGRPLSPRDVVLELQEQSAHESGIGGVLGGLLADARAEPQQVVRDDGVRAETIWACMQCNACVEVCPVGVEQAPIINQLRRRQVDLGEIEPALQTTLQTVHTSGNSFGESRRRRGRWTRELDFEVKDARKEPVDILWFVGDFASFDPRSQRVTQALARILRAAEVDFGILYDGERNAGNDIRRIGEEGLFEMLAEQNIDVLAGCEFNRVMTSDPHSLNTLRNEYPDLGGGWEILHHTAVLLELIEAGRLDLRDKLPYRVTYHDPCHLGRFNGEYEAPRAILAALGCTLVEMPRNRERSFCCGAGGGRIWIPDEPGVERPSENRIHEAVDAGRPDYFVVTCPKDVTMYEDAIKTSGHADDIELRELTELVEEALAGASAPAST